MFKKIVILAAFAAISSCFNGNAQAQYGGIQLRMGGFGPGAQLGGFGNGFYSGYGNSSRFGNGFYNGYGNNFRYGNSYQRGYGNYGQRSAVYNYGNSYRGFGNSWYPTMSYRFATPRYYSSPARRHSGPRFR